VLMTILGPNVAGTIIQKVMQLGVATSTQCIVYINMIQLFFQFDEQKG